MNGKRAKELRRAARMLEGEGAPERDYWTHPVRSWRGHAVCIRNGGVRETYRKLKRAYKAAQRGRDPQTMRRLAHFKASNRRAA